MDRVQLLQGCRATMKKQFTFKSFKRQSYEMVKHTQTIR